MVRTTCRRLICITYSSLLPDSLNSSSLPICFSRAMRSLLQSTTWRPTSATPADRRTSPTRNIAGNVTSVSGTTSGWRMETGIRAMFATFLSWGIKWLFASRYRSPTPRPSTGPSTYTRMRTGRNVKHSPDPAQLVISVARKRSAESSEREKKMHAANNAF